MIEAVLADSMSAVHTRRRFPLSGLSAIARLFAKPLDDLWTEYRESRGFTELHEVLLGIKCDCRTLDDYLTCIARQRAISDLIDRTDASGRSALSWAVEHDCVNAVATLIKFGANVNQHRQSANGSLPMLHLALAGPNSGERGKAFLGIVQQLLVAGANVNAVDNEGWTALHIAASWKDYRAVRTLLECAGQRIHWSALTNSHKSASQLAGDGGGDRALVELLVSHEFDEVFRPSVSASFLR
jgi:ankyrin repeat protein